MTSIDWKQRAKIVLQRFWQPCSACMSCMPGNLGKLLSAAHWQLALQTGLVTALLALLLSFTPAAALYRNRYGNALLVGCLTAVGDSLSHPNHYGIPFAEPIVTGLVSAGLALAGSYLFEDRARRLRQAWSRWFG